MNGVVVVCLVGFIVVGVFSLWRVSLAGSHLVSFNLSLSSKEDASL